MKNYEVKNGTYVIDDKVVDFQCYTDIPVVKKVSFINSVCDIVVDENHYYSILKNMIFDFMLVDAFTDIDLTDIKENINNLSAIEEFLDSGIADYIKSIIDDVVLLELNKAVDDNIAYKTGIHTDMITNALVSLMNTIEDKIGNLDTDEMVDLAKKLGVNEENLTADKIIEAYRKTDMFGKTIDEIKETKDKQDKAVKETLEALKEIKKK